MSYLWKSLMAKFGVKLLFSSSSHPQTDGQTEVDMGWPDLLSKLAVMVMMVIDNLVSPMISPR
jgi:hypothetical protein